MKITVLDGFAENPGDLSWEPLSALGDLTVYDRTPMGDKKEIIRRIEDAEIILTNKTPVDAETIGVCRGLKYIGVLASGYNVVDVAAASQAGITVTNIPEYGTMAVGQYAIALLLEICHHIGHHNAEVHAGRWQNNEDWCFWDYPLIELADKVMGIVGMGRIGQVTAKLAAALGMKVLAYDSNQNAERAGIADYVSFERLLAESDVISLHCPLFPETERLIRRENISKMKDGVILINNSRGGLIDEQDLTDALNIGKVYAAGLDVVSIEPVKPDNPLLKAKNCIITPHISWASIESRQRLMDIAVANVRAFIDGRPVNKVECRK